MAPTMQSHWWRSSMTFRRALLPVFSTLVAIGLFAALAPNRAVGQSTTSGDISGVISDPSGAAIPGATVTLTNADTGTTKTTSTSATGSYRFSLLQPGNYIVSATATGFSPQKFKVAVSVGQVQSANIELKVGAAAQTVTVTGEAAPVQTTNGDVSTSFTPAQVALVPNSGGDLTQTVQTSPGAVMNTQGGNGNFSTWPARDLELVHRQRTRRQRSLSQSQQLRRDQPSPRPECCGSSHRDQQRLLGP